jgi:hypothetical protein
VLTAEYTERDNKKNVDGVPKLSHSLNSERAPWVFVLECRCCGMRWSATADENCEFPSSFWVCPSRCNWVTAVLRRLHGNHRTRRFPDDCICLSS